MGKPEFLEAVAVADGAVEIEGKTSTVSSRRRSRRAPSVPSSPRPPFIGGSMETGSALLVGTAHAKVQTFGSTARGARRAMSRAQSKRRVRGEGQRGVVVRAATKAGVDGQAGFAYKDLREVVSVVDRLDISREVGLLTSIGNIRG